MGFIAVGNLPSFDRPKYNLMISCFFLVIYIDANNEEKDTNHERARRKPKIITPSHFFIDHLKLHISLQFLEKHLDLRS
jgi:hypothetical protein